MKIFAIGRNYIDHAKELNNPVPENPIIFLKPDTAVLKDNKDFYYPEFSKNIQFETEVVLRVCKEGKHVTPKFASTYFDAVGLGIDFTARDVQQELKAKSLPWELAKAFDHSAVISNLIPKEELTDVNSIEFSLQQNGQTVQQGNTRDMIFSYEDLIVYTSKFITLRKGDLIYTGTPVGVGSVAIGDLLEGFLGEQKMFSCKIK